MTWSEVAVVVIVAIAVLVWWVWVAASRLDRLHRKVGASRAALDTQLVRRASAAAEIATAGVLDPVTSLLVADAAWDALTAGGYGRDDLEITAPDLAASLGEEATPPARPSDVLVDLDESTDHDDPTAVDPGAQLSGADERQQAESALSRTLRAAFAEPDALPEGDVGDELVTALVAAWYRVQLARRFHNEAVAQTQRVRRKALVRLLRLAGRARMPQTVEIDDRWPDALPRPGQVA